MLQLRRVSPQQCRAGTETKWYFGDTRPSDWSTKWAQITGTTSATLGQREPNPWGFYDFYGNAGDRDADPSEWTSGDAQTLLTAAGEGAYVWTPPVRGLYKVTLTVGEYALTAYYDLLDAVVPVTPGALVVFDTAAEATNAAMLAELMPSPEVEAALGGDALRTYCNMFTFKVVETEGGQWTVEAVLTPEAESNLVENTSAATRQIPVGDIAALGSGEPTNVTVGGCVPGFYYTLRGSGSLEGLEVWKVRMCTGRCCASRTSR